MNLNAAQRKPFVGLLNKVAGLVVFVALLLYFIPAIMGTQTFRQRLLQLTYPVLMRFTKLSGSNAVVLCNKNNTVPPQSFYTRSVSLNNGQKLQLEQFRGYKLLLVNTASNCGYTNQYAELQQLWEQYKGELQIIGFPANDFKEQEKGSDAEIAQFCKRNFGVDFLLAQKSSVVKGAQQNEVFRWLTDAQQNGWNNHAPDWNFSKYLINEKGVLTHYFGPSVSPLGKAVQEAVMQQ